MVKACLVVSKGQIESLLKTILAEHGAEVYEFFYLDETFTRTNFREIEIWVEIGDELTSAELTDLVKQGRKEAKDD